MLYQCRVPSGRQPAFDDDVTHRRVDLPPPCAADIPDTEALEPQIPADALEAAMEEVEAGTAGEEEEAEEQDMELEEQGGGRWQATGGWRVVGALWGRPAASGDAAALTLQHTPTSCPRPSALLHVPNLH